MTIDDLQPLGPAALRQRMEELRSQMGVQSGPAFQMPQVGPGITGTIGVDKDGFKPVSVFAPGIGVSGDSAPPALKGLIDNAANENGVDPALLDAVVAAESSYDPQCRSHAGAMGLTQLMPDTAKAMGVKNPFDPAESLQGGAKYLSQMLAKYGDIGKALAAYNAGPGAVDRAGGIPPYAETQKYVAKVQALYNLKKAGK